MRSRFFWEALNTKVDELHNMDIISKLPAYLYEGSRFYITYYICPCCHERLLYKTNTLGEFTVLSAGGATDVSSVFTCPACRAFYASKPGIMLAEGNGFKIERLMQDAYIALLTDVESVGVVG